MIKAIFAHRDQIVYGIFRGGIVVYDHMGNIRLLVVLGTHDNGIFHSNAVQGLSGGDAVAKNNTLIKLAVYEKRIGGRVIGIVDLLQKKLIVSAPGGVLHSDNTLAVKWIDKISKAGQKDLVVAPLNLTV